MFNFEKEYLDNFQAIYKNELNFNVQRFSY